MFAILMKCLLIGIVCTTGFMVLAGDFEYYYGHYFVYYVNVIKDVSMNVLRLALTLLQIIGITAYCVVKFVGMSLMVFLYYFNNFLKYFLEKNKKILNILKKYAETSWEFRSDIILEGKMEEEYEEYALVPTIYYPATKEVM